VALLVAVWAGDALRHGQPLTKEQQELMAAYQTDAAPANTTDINELVSELQDIHQAVKDAIVKRLHKDQNDAMKTLNVTKSLLAQMRTKIAELRGKTPPSPTNVMNIAKYQRQLDELEKKSFKSHARGGSAAEERAAEKRARVEKNSPGSRNKNIDQYASD